MHRTSLDRLLFAMHAELLLVLIVILLLPCVITDFGISASRRPSCASCHAPLEATRAMRISGWAASNVRSPGIVCYGPQVGDTPHGGMVRRR